MRILFATAEYPPQSAGGISRNYFALASALVRAKCEVHVLVSAAFGAPSAEYSHDGVTVHCVGPAAISAKMASLSHLSAVPYYRRWLAAALAAADVARTLGPWDCIQTSDFGLMFVPFLTGDEWPPTVVQLHGSLGQISEREPRRPSVDLDLALIRLTEATLLGRASRLVSNGRANAAEWERRLGRSVAVVPPAHGIGSGAVSRQGEGAVVFARVQPWKGPALLCEALRREELPISVTWVGRDTETAEGGGSLSRALADVYPSIWGHQIRPAGALPWPDAAEIRQKARAVVVPSIWDVFSISAVEGMADARVVVCSEGAGASDVIESGRNGLVFESGNPKALAESLKRMVRLSPSDAERLGNHARETVMARFSPTRAAEDRIAIYQQATKTGMPASPGGDEWTRQLFSEAHALRTDMAFLHQVGSRQLVEHLIRRLVGRLLRRAGKA